MRFQDEIAIVVERSDCVRTDAGWRRVHQEDICQAFAIPPTRKYQNEGGPGIRDIVGLLNTYSTSAKEDVGTFLDSLAYNWLIAGTDAHAKNYSVLIGAEARIRLAPLYDVASVLPYTDIDIEKVKLSMKLGGEYRLRNIGLHQWRKLAGELHIDPEEMIARGDSIAVQLADNISDIKSRMSDEGVVPPIVARLADALIARAAACRKILKSA